MFKALARLATLAGRESPVARSVSEGVERLSRVLATNMVPVALALVPVVLATVLTVPSSLHHLAGNPPVDTNAPAAHMC